MRKSPLVFLLFTMIGCGSATDPARPSAETTATAKTPGAATVKKQMTQAQLELGDPMVNSVGMVLVPIPAGQFQMGSPDSDPTAYGNQKPQTLVKITRPFYLSAFEVTQQQYEKVMGGRPWQGEDFVRDGPDNPATYVSWNEAAEFCRKLSEQEGVEYRLPTRAQWEFACRAGTTTIYSFGNDVSKLGQYAWYDHIVVRIGEMHVHRVGRKLPNSWGLYDMHGNVSEWCRDWYSKYDGATVNDPSGPVVSSGLREYRGGSYVSGSDGCRSAARGLGDPDGHYFNLGFRVSKVYN